MARKTKEDSQKTRDAILDGAERVFLAKGIASTTMADIADAAGVSRGAVYGHYANKIEVCLAMTERAMQHDHFDSLPRLDSPMAALAQAAGYYLLLWSRPGQLQRVGEILYFKCERNEENRPILRRRNLMDSLSMRYSRRLLKQAIACGELPADLDVPLCNRYLYAVFDGIYSMLKFSYDEGQAEQALADSERMIAATLAGLPAAPQLRRR
ncbi:TetR family transcriptional regulator [uncultured Aquitalea sp.]|uniref:TetR family transcriptional regulator n=1 Tax=uncultured Aquitalea sp. TaxID=540272 RepID=UPI0025F51F6B|nr:TetR family transcriptional regulator [uncultured Aquitalea sp.]